MTIFFKGECYQISDRAFNAEISTTRINDITLSLVRGLENRTERTFPLLRNSYHESVFITYQIKGTYFVSQNNRKATLRPGDFTCFDSARPSVGIQNGEYEHLLIHIPRDTWIRKFGSPEQITARVVRGDSQIGSLAGNVLRQIVPVVDTVEPFTAYRMVDVALSLVMTAFGGLICLPEIQKSSGRASLLFRAKTFIQENLQDPDLTPKEVAASLGISERYLQDLFQDENISVGRWTWKMRLEKCRQCLTDPLMAGKSLTEIAFNCGFNSCSHFSRRFKDAFSMTPSEYRHEQQRQILKSPEN